MKISQMFLITAVFLAAMDSWGVTECGQLAAELKAMKQAQKVLLNNLVQNNETMANTLDQYAGDLRGTALKKRPVSAKELKSLKMSAEAFRLHKAREEKLIAKFDMATADLVQKVESCLIH